MFDVNMIKEENFGKTKVISKTINLWNKLDLFISASSKNSGFLDYVLNKIFDYTIDRISEKNTYKDFSHSLELINSVLKTWYNDAPDEKIHMIIWVLNKKEFLFSNIWNSSCYLVKNNNVIEITDPKDKKKEFSFISNWTLEDGDIICMSSKRLLSYLSESDFIDSYNTKISKFNSGIKQILEEEKIEKNFSINSFIYKEKKSKKSSLKTDFLKEISLKIWDTSFVKRIIAFWMIIKENFLKREKILKSIGFVLIILLTILFLYKLINNTISDTNVSKTKEIQIIKLEEAKTSLRKASENTTNKDIFNLNIKHTEKIISKLEEEKLFLEDIKLLKEKISNLKKSFDWIQSFEEKSENKILNLNSNDTIKIIWLNKKIYIIWKNYVQWPIIKWVKSKKYIFNELKDDDFIDATPLVGKISIVTKKWNIILFSSNWNFKTSDVIGQDSWENSDIISSYNSNIYLISKKDNQIFKHKKSGDNFTKWIAYLTPENQKSIKNMEDIAIDWGFYIIQKDLKITKFFANPKNRLEKLDLNKFPDNYKIEDKNAPIKIKTRADLNYVYILINNKIFITKPNSRRVQDTKSLKYLGQIEWQKNKIIDFYIKYDWELLILTKTWIYKILFEENEDKILLR